MVRTFLMCAILTTSLLTETTFAQSPSAQTKVPTTTPATAEQAKNPATSAQTDKQPAATSPETAPDAAVITIHGLCEKHDKSAASDGCTTTIKREEFDKITKAVTKPDQQLPPSGKRTLAEKYVDLLVFANAAKEAGVERSAEFNAALNLLRLRTMAEFYQRQLEQEYRNPSQAEIDAYYKEHAGDFASANLSRIYVPRNDPSGKAVTPEQKAAFSTKAQQVADEMRDRAAKGEGLEKLQKECYEKLGISSPPPSITIGAVRKGSFAAADDKQLFALEPGGVFKSEAAGAYTIYKVDSKQTLTQDSVKDEIARTIFRQKMEKRTKELNTSVKADFDAKYFGPPPAQAADHR